MEGDHLYVYVIYIYICVRGMMALCFEAALVYGCVCFVIFWI